MLRVAPEVIELLNGLIRHEDRADHARVLAELVDELGGMPATREGGDLPPIVLDALRRNLLAKR